MKNSLKLYFATLIFTLAMASFSFAGEVQCPIAPPPPPPDEDGRVATPIIADTNPAAGDSNQFLSGFWEFLTQSTDLF
jgi:hypothetical protein